MKITDQNKARPVTTIVQHHIKAGAENVFEDWSERIRAACRHHEGYLGTEIIKPVAEHSESGANKYVCIFRFDTVANLEKWMDAPERESLISESRKFNAQKPHYTQYNSLEFMFEPQTTGSKPPSREKMAFVTFLGLIAPVYYVPPLVNRYVTEDAFFGTLASLGIITPMMVYLIMPILTKLASPWLRR